MKTFAVTLQGYDLMRVDTEDLIKQVNAPSRAVLDSFIAICGLRRWLHEEPYEISSRHDADNVDAILDDQGNIIQTIDGDSSAAPGCTLVRAWREAVCLATIQRAPNQAAVLLAALIDLIDATGGLTTNEDGTDVPVAAGDWPDLADVYHEACQLVHIQPMQQEEDDDA